MLKYEPQLERQHLRRFPSPSDQHQLDRMQLCEPMVWHHVFEFLLVTSTERQLQNHSVPTHFLALRNHSYQNMVSISIMTQQSFRGGEIHLVICKNLIFFQWKSIFLNKFYCKYTCIKQSSASSAWNWNSYDFIVEVTIFLGNFSQLL